MHRAPDTCIFMDSECGLECFLVEVCLAVPTTTAHDDPAAPHRTRAVEAHLASQSQPGNAALPPPHVARHALQHS